MARRILIAHFLCFIACVLAGCGPTDKKGTKEGGKVDEHAGHDHSAKGPHEGHLVELGNEEYHAEWGHDDESGKVTVWILDSKAKGNVPIAAESIVIKTKNKEETESFELPAVDRTTGEKPAAFKFEIVSKELVGKLETPKITTPTIHVDVNGTPFVGKIEEHAEHDHARHKH